MGRRKALVFFFLEIFLTITDCSSNNKRYDICRPFNQKKVIYTTVGSRGTVYAKNDSNLFNLNYSKLNESFSRQCSLHILSCPSCMVNLRFKDVNLTCSKEGVCNSVCIVEPPYLILRSLKCVDGTAKNNSSIHYKSLTSQVNLNFVSRYPYRHAFTAEYLITRNTQLAEIKPEFNNKANISFGGYVSTPFFPISYPNDLTFEQVINCKASVTCLIHLIFVDFQIAEESIIEFYDSDRKRLGVTGGITFRPPVMLSSGPMLYIKFFANAGSSIGYKAQYSCVQGNVQDSILKPNTNCGGFVENKGGAITMMHMVEEFEPAILFDCIWLFRTSHKYYNSKTHNLYMKVITLNDLAEANLVVQEGRTSDGRLLQWRNGSHFVELAVPIEVGYYVRLTGKFNSNSRLEIAYAAFSQSRPCFRNEFRCGNERCIPVRLQCDGFDHCGDNSDESPECFEVHDRESAEYTDKSWYAYKSNYYFPNSTLYSKRYHILIGCFIGFIVFLIIILLAVYKITTHYHFQTNFHNRLISISQLLCKNIHHNF
ncbi:CUB domain,Low-density lipoprotein (LDL) receptor class A repeat,Low-density lipoprotein (LDL) [Cinara cedri]|uniref:CUB domain,Low-density lipoprotein (LDL) receptor class A repeat,Low-density lipoprotein (LDL) n=1 Tax=Cinara cedri TaxID=506608 RepID=A0A5E4M335_9HEMI|nr:CUB domain,Low-density lipoprotein (LDL) receptor class A repeat,Low-density lipoprotein (LDL) [Cinara cedri]